MLITFSEDEILKIGRGMAQNQEGLISLYEYLERAYPAAAMQAVNSSGDQSEKFKGIALCLEQLFTDLAGLSQKAEELTRQKAVGTDSPGHVLIA